MTNYLMPDGASVRV